MTAPDSAARVQAFLDAWAKADQRDCIAIAGYEVPRLLASDLRALLAATGAARPCGCSTPAGVIHTCGDAATGAATDGDCNVGCAECELDAGPAPVAEPPTCQHTVCTNLICDACGAYVGVYGPAAPDSATPTTCTCSSLPGWVACPACTAYIAAGGKPYASATPTTKETSDESDR